jgi:hypothetical protein
VIVCYEVIVIIPMGFSVGLCTKMLHSNTWLNDTPLSL